MRYVILYIDGSVGINQFDPSGTDGSVSRVIAVETFTGALEIQSAIRQAYALGGSEIDEYKKININLMGRVNQLIDREAALESEVVAGRNRAKDCETVMYNIMNALALDVALERKHQQRNAAIRHIVRLIKRVLDNATSGDMDDVPF